MKIYFAVNPDGTEVCSNTLLRRYSDELKGQIERDARYEMYSGRQDCWCDTYSNGYFAVPTFDGVILPKGSIKLMTGREITWEDDPIINEF